MAGVEDFSLPAFSCSPKRLLDRTAEVAPPTRRVRTDIQLGLDLNWADTVCRDRFGLAPLPSSGEQTPCATTLADMEVAFADPMELWLRYHNLFPTVDPVSSPLNPIPRPSFKRSFFSTCFRLYSKRMPDHFGFGGLWGHEDGSRALSYGRWLGWVGCSVCRVVLRSLAGARKKERGEGVGT